MLYQSLFTVAGFAATVLSHGVVTSPPIRAVGSAMTAACGQAVADLAAVDVTDHVEGLPELAATTANFDDTACNVFLCRGMQFEDNTANVQTFAPGQLVNMLASIPIPHEGPMNVSVIDTKTNTAIGEPLIVFDSYADESLAQLPANNTDFDVTIPTTLGSACSVAGDCVLQWFWFGTGADQTYESCVDMVVADTAASSVVSPAIDGVAAPVANTAGKASKKNTGKKAAKASVPAANFATVATRATVENTKRTLRVFKAKQFKS